jgi:aspartyl-tRNA(Asn)/glutamyl-tRNA(Gln) amidotransferase subunit B
MEYEATIGLEVHAQLLTESKIFCGCSTKFGASPNSNTCPVCLGLPGVLPVLNRRVVEFALKAALATHCEVALVSRWARKNYFYPDLPKGYQISMYELPLAHHGYLDIAAAEGGMADNGHSKRVRLTRIHMEEDAGKNIHDAHGDASLVDFNRTGVPLLEIVSEPDMRTPAEAGAYLRSLRAILQYLEVCDGSMEEGSFRCDANVSLRPSEITELGVKTEVKNLNSFKAVEKALEYEIRRQTEILSSGGKIEQETRLWDADREVTRSMRSKEHAHDYRYFTDPDLLPLVVEKDWIEEVRATLPELPDVRKERFVRQHGIPEYNAEVLTARKDVGDYYEAAVQVHNNPKAISNWIMDSVLRLIKEERLDERLVISRWPVPAEHLGDMVRLIDEDKISGKIAKMVFQEMYKSGQPPEAIVKEKGLIQVTDEGAIEEIVDKIMAENRGKVADYRAGKERLMSFFVGQVMKATQGKANPRTVNEILQKKLGQPG